MINKKLLLLILLFPLSIYGESFQHLKKEHQAPYSGYLFSPEALAKVTVEKKKDVEMCRIEKEHIEEMYRHVGLSALMAAVSAGIELGILETNAIGGQIVHVE